MENIENLNQTEDLTILENFNEDSELTKLEKAYTKEKGELDPNQNEIDLNDEANKLDLEFLNKFPKTEIKKVKKKNQNNSNKQEIETILRIRPCPENCEEGSYRIKEDGKNLEVILDNAVKTFSFSKAFGSSVSQEEFFVSTCLEAMNKFIYNYKSGLIFTYCMTCSVKN